VSCDHLERSGLERVLGGEDDHVAGCGDCQSTLAGYQRLERALAATSADAEPRVGWQSRVLATAKPPEPAPRRWWMVAAPLAAAATAVAVWVALPSRPSGAPTLAVSVAKTGARVRGEEANVGDTLRIEGRGGRGQRVLWIYRDDRLVLACPSDGVTLPGIHGSRCASNGSIRIAELVVDAPGTLQIVYVTALSGEIQPTGSLDADLAQATRAGELRKTTIEVR